MKKFSQYINFQKDCNCGQQVDESILSSLKDRLKSTLANKIGGAGLQAVHDDSVADKEKKKNAVRDQKINYAKCVELAKKDEEDLTDAKTPDEKKRITKRLTRRLNDCNNILKTKVNLSQKDMDKQVNAQFDTSKQEYDAMMAAISGGSGGGSSGSGGGSSGSGGGGGGRGTT